MEVLGDDDNDGEDGILKKETDFRRTQHHGKYRLYWLEHGDTCSLCEEHYTQGRHTFWSETQVCDCYRAGDAANKHSQKL